MNKYSFVILQAAGGEFLSVFVTALVVLGVFLGIFLIIRSIMLWYWKVDIIVRNQEEQIRLLARSFEQENRRNARVNYYKYATLGDKRQAYESLVYIIYHDLTVPDITQEDRKNRYEKLRPQYQQKCEALGYEFPPYPF